MAAPALSESLPQALVLLDRLLLDRPSEEGILQAVGHLAHEHLGAEVAIVCRTLADLHSPLVVIGPGSGVEALLLETRRWSSRRMADPAHLLVPFQLPPADLLPSVEQWIVPVYADSAPRAYVLLAFSHQAPSSASLASRNPDDAVEAAPLAQALALLAGRVAAGIVAAGQYAAMQRAVALQATLNEISLAMSAPVHEQDRLWLMVTAATGLTGAAVSSLFVRANHSLRCAARVAVGAHAPDEASPAEISVAIEVLETNSLVLGDAQGQPVAAASLDPPASAATLGLPIRYEHQMLGVLCLSGPPPGGFTASHAALLWILASHAAVTIENARLIDEERRRAHQATILLDAANAGGATLELDVLLSEIVATTARLTGADRSSILLLDESSQQLQPAALFNMDAHFVRQWRRQVFPLESELLSHEAIRTGKPVVVRSAETDPRTNKDAVRLFNDKSILVVPIVWKGDVLGTLWVNHVRHYYDFTDDDIQTTVAIANQAAMAISNARLYKESQRKSDQLAQRRLAEVATVLGVSTEIASMLHIDAMLASVARNVRRVLQVDLCRIYRITEPSGDVLLAAEARGDDQAAMPETATLTTIVRDSLLTGSPLVGPAADLDSLGPYRSLLCAPLIARDRKLGGLCVLSAQPHDFLEDEQQLLMAFANQVAVAIEHAGLFESLRRRVHELSGLHQLSLASVTRTTLPETVTDLTAKLAELLDVEHCVILLHDDATQQLVPRSPGFGLTDAQLRALGDAVRNDETTRSVWRTGQPYRANAVPADGSSGPWVAVLAERTLLLVPMRVAGATIGIIRAANKRQLPFSDDDVQLLTIFATHAAAMLQGAIILDRVRRERSELDAILENTSDSIFVFGLDGRLIRLNRAAETLFGLPQHEGHGRRCRELFQCTELGPRSSCPIDCVVARVASEQTAMPYLEHVVLAGDGREIDVTTSYTFIPGRGTAGGRVVAITRDISRLKEVDRLKSDFVSMVSHELRTPLAVIKGFASTLVRLGDTVDKPTEQRWLQSIDESCDRLTRLIDNLLNVSRIESGRFTSNLQLIPLNEIVRRAVADVSMQAQARTIELHLPEQSPRVLADRDQIEQVLINLLTNALKYTRRDGPIVVGVVQRGGWIQTTVSDPGPGIPSAQLAHVFEKFYRGEAATSRRASGSGLGLYICKSILDAHDGKIWVDSSPMDGSTFGFALRAQGDPPPSEP